MKISQSDREFVDTRDQGELLFLPSIPSMKMLVAAGLTSWPETCWSSLTQIRGVSQLQRVIGLLQAAAESAESFLSCYGQGHVVKDHALVLLF